MLIAKSEEIPADAGTAGAAVVVVVATVVVVVGATVVVVTGAGAGTRLDTSVNVYWLSNPVCADAPPTPKAAKPATPKPSATDPTPTFFMKLFILCSFLLTD
jgi:phage tail tape-measure protein